MSIASETLEVYQEQLSQLDSLLAKSRGAEVTRSETIERIAGGAKEWLRLSQQLRALSIISVPVLEKYDTCMAEVLNGTRARTRASSYRTKLKPFLDTFFDDVVIPLIRFEGSPAQVAARQVETVFQGSVTADEASYIEEAARCTGAHCHRAALVLLWAAGMARMHRGIEKVGFDSYNSALTVAAGRKGSPFNKLQKSAVVSSLPELQRTRDFDILVVGMDLWKYDLQAYEELDRLLSLRNSAAHPGMFQPSAIEVQQFAIKLNRFVFEAVPV